MGYKKNKKKQDKSEYLELEDYFTGYYFIAGFTEAGFPYGITMEEAEEQGLIEKQEQSEELDWSEGQDIDSPDFVDIDDKDLPF